MRFKTIYVVQGANVEDAFLEKKQAETFRCQLENKSHTSYTVREIRLYYEEENALR